MAFIIKLVSKAPLLGQWRLELQRSYLSRVYKDDIMRARKSHDNDKVRSLQNDFRVEMDLLEENEDEFHTNKLLRQARHLRVQIPHRKNEAGKESDYWYQGHFTGGWYLTNMGTLELRKEIRCELKARREAVSTWVIWVSGITGVIGAISGLVAVLTRFN